MILKKIKFITLGSFFVPTFFFVSAGADTSSKETNPVTNSFKKAPGSITKDGENGTIFQAKNGDIYVMGYGTGLEVLKSGYKNFVPAPGSITKDGQGGVIFQAKNEDIYVMGYGTGLEVLELSKDATDFKAAPGSITTDGAGEEGGGVIFQAKNEDIYVMGYDTGLEVLELSKGATDFKAAPGSITKDGEGGTIFQAKNEDIYVMGYDTGLEVLELSKGATSFKVAPGSITKDGTWGTIFQAKNEDIYVMGYDTGLEVLKKDETDFKAAPGSITTDGAGEEGGGVIFQAKNEDIYVMGYDTGLEVLELSKGATDFKAAPGSQTDDGAWGTIFQAKNEDIYVMGYGTGLEVLKKDETDFKAAPGSITKDGEGGTIFQSKNEDIYVMGYDTGLEVLELSKGATDFKAAPGSITKDGEGGIIFQAKNGDLYVMGSDTELEVLKLLEFNKEDKNIGNSNDGSIIIVNKIDSYPQFKYKLKSSSNWQDVPTNGKIQGLAPGKYEFKWVGKSNEQYVEVINIETKVPVPANPTFTSSGQSVKDKNNGFIAIAGGTNTYSKLQYKKKEDTGIWKDVVLTDGKIEDLAPGTYQFRWISKKEQQYEGGTNTFKSAGETTVATSNKIPVPAVNPVFTPNSPSVKDGTDGYITVKDGRDAYSQLQYKLKDSDGDWKNMVKDSELAFDTVSDLSKGIYEFQWVGKNNEDYEGDVNVKFKSAGETTVATSNKIPVPTNPTFTSSGQSAKGKTNGSIAIAGGTNNYSKLQYKKKEDTGIWKDVVLTDGKIEGLDPGTYQFQWVGKNNEDYEGDENVKFKSVGETVVATSNKIPVPANPTFTSSRPSIKGKKGSITITGGGTNTYSKLQYKKKEDASSWKNVPSSGKIDLTPGIYQFQWVGKSNEQYEGGTDTFKPAGEKAVATSNKIPVPAANPTFTSSSPIAKGKKGYITITGGGTDTYSKLQYKKKNTGIWKDVPSSGKIEGLAPGTYQFQWVGKNNEQYEGGTNTSITIAKKETINPPLITKKTSDNKKTTLILATTIPTGLIFVIAIILTIRYKYFKKQKQKS